MLTPRVVRSFRFTAAVCSLAICCFQVGAAQSPARRAAAAESLMFWLADGAMVPGAIVGWDADADGPRVLIDGEDAVRRLGRDDLLSVHGKVPPASTGRVQVDLVGGGALVGELLGGDEAGETFVIQSSALGRLAVSVDRLAVLRFLARAGGAGADAFAVPSSEADEALFRPLRSGAGFSSLVGSIHRFDERAVYFERQGDGRPRPYLYTQLAAVSVRGGFGPEEPGPWLLLTRAGDRIRVRIDGLVEGNDSRLAATSGDGVPLQFAIADIACLAQVREDRVPLASLEPDVVEQGGYFDPGQPLLRYRNRLAVDGSRLGAAGRAWTEGVGVHSRTRLLYRVPERCTVFVARAAIDDSVRALPVRADVLVTVKVGTEAIVDAVRLRSGDAAIPVGPVAVSPGQMLELLVDFGAGLDLGDRVDWLGAQFLMQ